LARFVTKRTSSRDDKIDIQLAKNEKIEI